MRMTLVAFALLVATTASAQEPVREVPDVISWGTAAAGPAIGVWRAVHSDEPMCKLSQLLVSTGIASSGLILQHFIHSPRPCLGSPGCSGNGMPSMHSAYSMIGGLSGSGSGWKNITISISFGVGTGIGRKLANRHTTPQVLAGLALGGASEMLGQVLVHCDSP